MNNFFSANRRKILINYLLLGVIIYFAFHVIYGNRGIVAYFKRSQKFETTLKELELMRAERLDLEHKVNSLKPQSLDRDMLDEQARKNLGVSTPEEKVFIP